MKQYKSLDLAKFICAVLIIILHTAPFSSYSKVLTFGFRNIVTIIAVPFFFTTSGFLAFRKLSALEEQEKQGYMKKYLMRLVVMYLIWSAVYFGFVLIKWIRRGFTISCVFEYVKDFFFEGSYSTIWFLPALISAVYIVYLLHKRLSYKTIFGVACVIYLFTLGGSSYYGLVTKIPLIKRCYDLYYSVFDTIKNGVCFGLIFVAMGALLSEYEKALIQKGCVKKAFLQVVTLSGFIAIEAFIIAWQDWNIRGVDTIISLVPFSWMFMKLLLQIDVNLDNKTCAILRKCSILMFLCQRIPLSIIEMFAANTIVAQNSASFFFTVLISTILLSFTIIQGSLKYHFLKHVF